MTTIEDAIEILGHAYQHLYDRSDKSYDPLTKPLPVLGELDKADRRALDILQASAMALSAELYE